MVVENTIWRRSKVLLRTIISSLLVLIAAVYPTSFLLQLNLAHLPSVPWSVLPGGIFLWLLWRYIGGWGPPTSTSGNRARYRRFTALPSQDGFWIWASGVSLAITITSYSVIRLLTETGGFQQTMFVDSLQQLPLVTVFLMLAMIVLMTAFFEEAAFRGYMQVQLEDVYRPAVAIVLTALAFSAVHFPSLGQWPLFVVGSIGWGILTRLSGTIVPAIVMHGIVDGAIFSWMWQDPDRFRALAELNVLHTGPDGVFLFWVAIAAVGTISTIFCFVMIQKAKGASASNT